MHAVKVDSRKIMAAGLVIVAVFAAVAITVNLFYLGQIQSLVRNTTTTSVMELATARAHYLDECLTSDQNSVKSLAHFIADVTPQEARDQVKDFISTHEAAAAWIRSKDGTTWCSSSETDLYDPALEDELFGPAMAGETGSSEMYLGHGGERRILFYAPIVDAPVTAGPGTATTPADPDDVLGAVYVSYPADELQNSYGTAYSSAGATFVVDSSGTIVLDANHGADEADAGQPFGPHQRQRRLVPDLLVARRHRLRYLRQPRHDPRRRRPVRLLHPHQRQERLVARDHPAAFGGGIRRHADRRHHQPDGGRARRGRGRGGGGHGGPHGVPAPPRAPLRAVHPKRVLGHRRQHRHRHLHRRPQGAPHRGRLREHPGHPRHSGPRLLRPPNELSPNEAYANVAAIVHSGAGDKARTWEFEADNPALGRSQWLRMTARPVMLAEREKTIFSLTDVTADHEIRARLERAATAAEDANRAKSSFLSSMSHDIRTPMNAILGFSTLIDREADNPAHVRDYNRKIATSGQHLLGLINDVLDMSKIEAGKTTLAASAFALSGTVESVEAMMRQQTDAKNQVFTVEVDKVEHDRLVGDEGRLRQILMNLLSNAMKYTPEGGHILFRVDGSAKRHGELQHLRIIVRDDGIGMSKDYLATIFDSFTREESSLTNKVQGTGLGMAITKNLIDLMGGTISVESELGTGSTFIVDLDFPPAGDESDGTEGDGGKRAGNAQRDHGNALAHKHVLVAEDNALNAEVITAILNIHDATCEVAANGEEAVAKFGMSAPGTFDMIFMDVQMPVMNGHDAARAIRAMDRHDAGTIPIIAMTANAFAEDERQALACGMNAHVAKPIDVHALERVVAELSQ